MIIFKLSCRGLRINSENEEIFFEVFEKFEPTTNFYSGFNLRYWEKNEQVVICKIYQINFLLCIEECLKFIEEIAIINDFNAELMGSINLYPLSTKKNFSTSKFSLVGKNEFKSINKKYPICNWCNLEISNFDLNRFYHTSPIKAFKVAISFLNAIAY